jgi:hypothetical protein
MTKASNESPTRRVLTGYQGQLYVVELRENLILIRPKGSRTGGSAEVSITPSALHDRLLMSHYSVEKAKSPTGRRKKVKRGLLSLR